jgi:hypothetical protein
LSIALVGASVRLLPWLLAPEIPLVLCWPFARALFAVGAEAAILIGLPLGVAIAASRFVARGEARALLALGARPARILAAGLGSVALLGVGHVLLLGTASYEAPGRFAAALLEQGRRSCAEDQRSRAVEVPLLRVAWLCQPGRAPRLVGTVPALRSEVWFTALSMQPNAQLDSVELHDARVGMRARGALPAVDVKARYARIQGLPRWGRPARLPPTLRAAFIASIAWLIAAATGGAILRAAIAHPMVASAMGGGAGLAALVALQAVDRSEGPLALYALVAAMAVLPAAGGALATRAGRVARGRAE